MDGHELPPDVIAAIATLVRFAKAILREAADKGPRNGDTSGAYYDARTAPMGPTAFLRLAREGAFPAAKVGRKVIASKADVDAWIQANTGKRRRVEETAKRPEVEDTRDALALHELIRSEEGARPKRRGKKA